MVGGVFFSPYGKPISRFVVPCIPDNGWGKAVEWKMQGKLD